jgi:hypothetical protein
MRPLLAILLTAGVCACQGAERPPPPRPKTPAAKPAAPTAMAMQGANPAAATPTANAASLATAEPAAPPYDLDADRKKRAEAARAELGRGTTVAVVSDVFVVIGPPGWTGDAFAQSVSLIERAMTAYLNGRFTRKPEAAITVYLFPSAQPYEAFCKSRYGDRCLSRFGFYRHGERDMVMNAGLGLGTLTHELVHPLVDVDFPQAPTWINEGIASVFEQPILPRAGEIHGGKNWRLPRLLQGLASAKEKDEARVDALFAMSNDAFRNDLEDLHYATARYVCQWLDERGKLWPFYRKWRETSDADPTGEKAFTEVVGMSPAQANVEWVRWVRAL